MSTAKVGRLLLLARAEKALKISSGVCALGLAALLLWRSGLAEPPQVTTTTSIYMPMPQIEATGAVSETESDASGYILVIETTPEGAEVVVDGVSKGASPSSLNLECLAGAPLMLELRHPGYAPLKRMMTCKRDVMVVVRATLEAAK